MGSEFERERQRLVEAVRATLLRYETSEEPFERARMISHVGKVYAPRLLEIIDLLVSENEQLRAALRPFATLAPEVAAYGVAGALGRLAPGDFLAAAQALQGGS